MEHSVLTLYSARAFYFILIYCQ